MYIILSIIILREEKLEYIYIPACLVGVKACLMWGLSDRNTIQI